MICYRDFTRLAKSTAKVMISFENWNKKAENFHSRLSFLIFLNFLPLFLLCWNLCQELLDEVPEWSYATDLATLIGSMRAKQGRTE